MGFGMRPVFSAAFAAFMCAAAAFAQVPEQHQRVVVANIQEFDAVIGQVRGGQVIALRPGDYGPLKIENLSVDQAVRIVPQDPASVPVIQRLSIAGSRNITIEGLRFSPPADAAAGFGLVDVQRSEGVSILASRFTAPPDRRDRRQRAVNAMHAVRLTIADNWLENLDRGIHVAESRDTLIEHNQFSRLAGDGVSGVGLDGVTIRSNRFVGLSDIGGNRGTFIQFWTRGTTTPSSRIRIQDNLLFQDTSVPVQGVFLGNEDRVPYRDVDISGNIVVLGTPQGIQVRLAENVVAQRNILIDTVNSNFNNTLRVSQSLNGEISGNLAVVFAMSENSNVRMRANVTISRLERQTRQTLIDRMQEGLDGKGPGRIHANFVVTPAHRAAGPRSH